MRDRIKTMRRQLVDKIRAQRADFDFSFVVEQRGMFSYSGLTKRAGAPAARGVFGLRDRQRPHLRAGAQLAQHRLRREGDRERSRLIANSLTRRHDDTKGYEGRSSYSSRSCWRVLAG